MTDINDHDGASDPDVDLGSDEARSRFIITDDGEATWAVRKYRALQHRVEESVSIAEAEIKRITEWRDTQVKKHEGEAEFFKAILTEYALKQRVALDRKSIDTPYGVVRTRNSTPKWEVDADQFIPWAKENAPELVTVVEKVALAAAKKALEVEDTSLGLVAITQHGEVVPGISIEAGNVTVNIDLKGE